MANDVHQYGIPIDRAASHDDERRQCERFPAAIPVAIRQRGERHRRARTWDLGERGVCINTRQPVAVGLAIEMDIEVIMPTRVRLGFDMDALVIDGPSTSHFARIPGIVRRCTACEDGSWDLGVEFCTDAQVEHTQIVDLYLDHLRDGFNSQFG